MSQIPTHQCPQCSAQGQNHFMSMDHVGMNVACGNGHVVAVMIKFKITEITITDVQTGKLITYNKPKEVETQEERLN
jgi:hypothetical protein